MTNLTKRSGAARLMAAALCATVLTFGASRAEESPQPSADARAMTAYEVVVLYSGKSWQWPDGAGRLESDGRRFTAISGSGETTNWAEGRWLVTDGGSLCLEANWHASGESYPDRTCFDHRVDGNTIYQRRSPAGDWFVFKHAQAKPDDEFSRLVPNDLVSVRLEDARSTTSATQPSSGPSISGVNDNE